MLPTIYPNINRLWLWYIVRPDLPLFGRRSKLKVEPTKNSDYNLGDLKHGDMATKTYARAMTKLCQN